MGLPYCLTTLRKTTSLLSKVYREISRIDNQENIKANRALATPCPLAQLVFAKSEKRSQADALASQITTILSLVTQYQILGHGIPLQWHLELESRLVKPFMWRPAGESGLEGLLRGEDGISKQELYDGGSDSEDEVDEGGVTDKEILETYWAIGCQSFTSFEIGVHRADKVWEMGIEMGVAGRKSAAEKAKKSVVKAEGEVAAKDD